MDSRPAVVLLNLGGPDSLSAVRPFLYNLFSDPDIIRLPFSWLMRRPIAVSITLWRTPAVQDFYRQMGGRSPILPLTQAQAQALQEQLGQDGLEVSVAIAMRYSA